MSTFIAQRAADLEAASLRKAIISRELGTLIVSASPRNLAKDLYIAMGLDPSGTTCSEVMVQFQQELRDSYLP